MTSSDTLGTSSSGNVSTILPSVNLNGTVSQDGDLIPRPWKTRVTSVEAGIGSSNASAAIAITSTYTPQQIADFIRPSMSAMGPDDELSPFARTLRSGMGAVGSPTSPPMRYLTSHYTNPLGTAMGDWRSSTDYDSQQPALRAPSSQELGKVDIDGATSPSPSNAFVTGAPPVAFLPPASQLASRGLLALLAEAGAADATNPESLLSGGLPGLIQEYLRSR